MYGYIEYLPLFLREIREFQALDTCTEEAVKASYQYTKQVYENQFLDTTDGNAISRWERILAILPAVSDSLDFRRERVALRLTENLPFTMRFLLQRLDAVFGKGKYRAWVSYGDWHLRLGEWKLGSSPFRDAPYVLHVETVAENAQWYHEIQVLIDRVKPANLVFSFSPMLPHAIGLSESIGTFPMIWNYRLGGWALGCRPFFSIQDKESASWNYRLGRWTLGKSAFGVPREMEVLKMAEVSSIQPEFLAEHCQLSAAVISAVRINGIHLIRDLQKLVDGNSLTIRYTISPLMQTGDITRIELLREDEVALTSSSVFIPVPDTDQIVLKHIIPHKEAF